MFILIDTDAKGLVPFYDYVNELDDKPVIGIEDLDDFTDYTPGGSFHVVDYHQDLGDLNRWTQLVWASRGVRVFSDTFDKESPLYAGPVPTPDKARKAAVDASNAATRAVHFAEFGVNYIGRTKLNPRNIFVLDNKKGNALHAPAKDATLEALYATLPADWWGSCGFVSSGNIERLEAFLTSFDGDVIPLAYTTGAYAKLRFMALDYVDTGVPTPDPAFGIRVRDLANRKSYDLAQPTTPQPEIEKPDSWLQL